MYMQYTYHIQLYFLYHYINWLYFYEMIFFVRCEIKVILLENKSLLLRSCFSFLNAMVPYREEAC